MDGQPERRSYDSEIVRIATRLESMSEKQQQMHDDIKHLADIKTQGLLNKSAITRLWYVVSGACVAIGSLASIVITKWK